MMVPPLAGTQGRAEEVEAEAVLAPQIPLSAETFEGTWAETETDEEGPDLSILAAVVGVVVVMGVCAEPAGVARAGVEPVVDVVEAVPEEIGAESKDRIVYTPECFRVSWHFMYCNGIA
jgi:hypothetical protein